MKIMQKTNQNLLVWGALMLLSGAGYLVFRQPGGLVFVGLLSALAFLKVMLVANFFMELKNAHPAWRWLLAGVLAVVLALVVAIY